MFLAENLNGCFVKKPSRAFIRTLLSFEICLQNWSFIQKICDKLIKTKTSFSSLGESYEEERVNPVSKYHDMQQYRDHRPKTFWFCC